MRFAAAIGGAAAWIQLGRFNCILRESHGSYTRCCLAQYAGHFICRLMQLAAEVFKMREVSIQCFKMVVHFFTFFFAAYTSMSGIPDACSMPPLTACCIHEHAVQAQILSTLDKSRSGCL